MCKHSISNLCLQKEPVYLHVNSKIKQTVNLSSNKKKITMYYYDYDRTPVNYARYGPIPIYDIPYRPMTDLN